MSTHVLHINQTWDGHPIPPTEHASLTLQPTPQHLLLTLDAPLHQQRAPQTPPQPFWGLWDYDVVEFFLVGPHENYLEVELGPKGHQLAFTLSGKRQKNSKILHLEYKVKHEKERWTGRAVIPWTHCPPKPWTWNAFAIHGPPEARRYLAAHPVPGPEPDFHRLELFPQATLS